MLRGLARDDLFTVVHEQVMTDTAAMADVVLPATTHFEADDLAASYGSFTMQRMRAGDRSGGREPDQRRGRGGARRRGGASRRLRSSPTPTAIIDRIVVDDGGAEGARVSARGRAPPCSSARRSRASTTGGHACTGRTASCRCRRSDRLDRAGFPLALLSPATNRTINSMLGEVHRAEAVLAVSPADAAARALVDGQPVRVWNDQASLVVPCRVDGSLRPGVVVLPKGLWRRHVPGGLTANALGAGHGQRLGRWSVLQ